jgi:two-component system nitrate/nitrite sensor histidine kinase NarX
MKGLNQPPRINAVECKYQEIVKNIKDGLIIFDLSNNQIIDANPSAWTMHGYQQDEFIGNNVVTLIHSEDQAVFKEYVQSFHPGSVFDMRISHVRRDGSIFSGDWRGTAITFIDQSCLLVIVRDISKRIQAEKKLHQHIETRTHEQATLLQISHTLASTLEFRPGLILDQLREIIEYSHGGLFALEDSSLVTLAMRGTPELEQSLPFRIHLQGTEALAVLFNGHRPIRIPDVWSSNSQAQFLQSLLDDGAAKLLNGMQSWMWVPLAVRGRIIGGVGVASSEKNYFTAHHADLALSVANQAAITMINAELYGQAQALAVIEERQRLARNLHDAVNQSLFSAGLIAEVLPRLWERDQVEAQRSLEDLRRLTRGAQAEMRALLAELRPSTLTDSNLGDLLHLLGNALTGRTNIPVNVKVIGVFDLPAEVQVAFYRVCQEALNNIAKHSKAKQVEIKLSQDGTKIELLIRDDGLGFNPEKKLSGHYGLGMMGERAESVGAVFSVLSQIGQGTIITMQWINNVLKEGK